MKTNAAKKSGGQAINAPRKSMFMLDPNVLVIIGRDTDDGPGHPRYDNRAHNNYDESVVIGMMKYGVKKPVSVIKKGDRLEVVDGRQRVINAREANRRLLEAGHPGLRVPVLPPEQGTDAKMAGLMAMLNTHVIVNTPLDLGQMARNLLDTGFTDEEVAVHLKVSVQTAKRYVSLLDLRPEIQRLIAEEKVPVAKGYELAPKGDKAQEAFLKRRENGSHSGAPKRRPSADALRKVLESAKLTEAAQDALRFALGDLTQEQFLDKAESPKLRVVKNPNPFVENEA